MSVRSAVVFLLVILAVVAGQAPALAGKKDGGGASTLMTRPAAVQASGAYEVGATGRIDDHTPSSNSSRDTLTVSEGTLTFQVPGSAPTSCGVTRVIFQSHENFEWFGTASAFDVSAYFTCSNTAGDQYTVFYPHCVGVVRSGSAAQPTFTFDAAAECGAGIDVKLKGQRKSTRLADGVAAPFGLTATLATLQ